MLYDLLVTLVLIVFFVSLVVISSMTMMSGSGDRKGLASAILISSVITYGLAEIMIEELLLWDLILLIFNASLVSIFTLYSHKIKCKFRSVIMVLVMVSLVTIFISGYFLAGSNYSNIAKFLFA